jgi:predicted hydrocarbon binding protein
MGQETATTIFATEKGIVALDSPIKLKILALLNNGVSSFDELVEKSGKAKSTVSVHLNDLQNMKLIEEKISGGDKRKKYFILNSLYLAYSEIPLRQEYYKHLSDVEISGLNGNSFLIHLFHTVRYGMEAYGFDPRPIMKRLGKDVGEQIGHEFKSQNINGILKELTAFWKNQELGEMTVIDGARPGILVTDCYHCGRMPNVGKTLCSMDEGIIEGIFSNRLNLILAVHEIECYGTGHGHCRFVIESI